MKYPIQAKTFIDVTKPPYLEIPDDDITTFCQTDTRKGVSIRYLTDRTAS